MPEIPLLTAELARRIERLVAPELRELSDDPTVPVVRQFGQTIASRMRGGQPSNKVYCFNGADLGRLGEILALYRDDGLEPWFYLTPVGFSQEVAIALSATGFVQHDFNQAILFGVPTPITVVLPQGMSIERVTTDNLETYAIAMADGFEWDPAWREAAIAGTISKFKEDSQSFLVRMNGEPAGVATLGLTERVGRIVGGAIVPKHRSKGCHLASVQFRIDLAYELGCDFLMGAANYGSPSFRNQLRAGLRLAYVEGSWGPS